MRYLINSPAAWRNGRRWRGHWLGAPQVLLLDEPFAALDALTKLQMQDLLIETVQAAGATVVMVTHDIDEAVYLADRVVILGQRPATIVATYHSTRPRPRDRSPPA